MENSLVPGLLLLLLSFTTIGIITRGFLFALRKSGWDSGQKRKALIFSLVLVGLWILILGILSIRGFFSHFSSLPPRPALAILIPLPFVIVAALSKKGSRLLSLVPFQWLVYIQTFRIFVEVILWLAYTRSLLPVQMTFEGRNFDILTGLLAIPVGYYCFVKKTWSRTIAVIWNILGLVLLMNILIIAVLSMPTPIRYFMNEPSNYIVAKFPFIYLPGVLVVIAYSMHIFSLRQLYISRSATTGNGHM